MASTDLTTELSIYKYVCCDIKPTKPPPPHKALVPVHPGIKAALSTLAPQKRIKTSARLGSTWHLERPAGPAGGASRRGICTSGAVEGQALWSTEHRAS